MKQSGASMGSGCLKEITTDVYKNKRQRNMFQTFERGEYFAFTSVGSTQWLISVCQVSSGPPWAGGQQKIIMTRNFSSSIHEYFGEDLRWDGPCTAPTTKFKIR